MSSESQSTANMGLEDVSRSTRWKKKRANEKLAAILAVGVVGIIILYIYSLTLGAYHISFQDSAKDIWNIITNLGPDENVMDEKVIFYLRMPRSLMALCVGAGLAVAGAVMQALIRNPLVDPYLTGVSSGASFMVVLVTLGGFNLGMAATAAVPLAAIIGAIVAFGATMFIAEVAGGRTMNYVLAGVIISTGLSSAITLVTYFNVDNYESVTKWLFGSFMDQGWENTLVVIMGTVIPMIVAFCFSKKLNIMLLGEEQAQYLGIDVKVLKRMMLVLIAILTAFCVAYCGVIGFVGLIVPHVCRMILGGDHRLLIPASAVVGALVMLIADIFCKTIIEPSELPIGAVVAVIGVPFFLFLMVKEGKRYAM
ncbi:FecCD family ABC transporter permease [Candidatus Methanoprimaticola sp. MG2]|uniref:FecCD family ABC transporter permease n=1 Tax=Candidatus Methanoprimaticola sp. MG2 TaxID=3228838 RepID=UPI0039C6831A